MKIETTTRHLRCVLTEKEILEVGKQSAELTRAIIALEDDKARISKDFGARIAEKEAQRSVLTDKIISGYEFRDVPCVVRLNDPKPGSKTIVRNDTIDVVAIELMNPDEMQEKLPLEDPPRVTAGEETTVDDGIDETTLDELLGSGIASDVFTNALESANLSTIREALARNEGRKRFQKRQGLLVEQEKKLVAALK